MVLSPIIFSSSSFEMPRLLASASRGATWFSAKAARRFAKIRSLAPWATNMPMPRRLWAILAVAFGVGLSVLDSAIANVALPTIGQELGISSADSIWIVNAYQLAIMVSLLSFSALGELVGYRKVYIGGLM